MRRRKAKKKCEGENERDEKHGEKLSQWNRNVLLPKETVVFGIGACSKKKAEEKAIE